MTTDENFQLFLKLKNCVAVVLQAVKLWAFLSSNQCKTTEFALKYLHNQGPN